MTQASAKASRPLRTARGFTLIEVLVALLILLLGLLGLIALQTRAQQAEMESYQRAQALVLLQDMVDRINANRRTGNCFAFTAGAGVPYLGASGPNSWTPACGTTGEPVIDEAARVSIEQWQSQLLGSSETLSGNDAGAMVGARGCVSLDNSVAAAPATITVAVAWQGASDTIAPAVADGTLPGTENAVKCGTGLYGAETRRRVVWTTIQLATLI